jgi:hypothetical protein
MERTWLEYPIPVTKDLQRVDTIATLGMIRTRKPSNNGSGTADGTSGA